MLRYFAWKERGFWMGGKLLTRTQIVSLLGHLEGRAETFASVQTYNPDETILSSPIYADLDHQTNLALVQADTRTLVSSIIHHLNVVPDIYFSGNKGFHVIVPHEIYHPRCHEIVRTLIANLTGSLGTLDQSVYRTRSLLRTEGSPASKPGYFKTKISRQELFALTPDEIQAIAKDPAKRTVREFDQTKLLIDTLADLVQSAIEALPERKPFNASHAQWSPMTPCLQTLYTVGTSPGNRNKAIFMLAKHFKINAVPELEAEAAMMAQPHFRDWEETGVTKVLSVIRSVYRNRTAPKLGCKTGSEGELLRAHCNPFCIFSDAFPELNIRGHDGTTPQTPSDASCRLLPRIATGQAPD